MSTKKPTHIGMGFSIFLGLHGNLWVNQCEIHQNPPSVKRQSGITAPLRVAFIPFVV